MQHLQPNTTLQGGKYRIERVLGQGGFGITYRAIMRDRVSGKLGAMEIEVPVAIKEFFMKDTCLRDEGSSYVTVPSIGSKNLVEQYRKKFVKEANNLSNLNHPNIVQVIDVFQENGTDYYVMEYLEGGSLRDVVKREGKLDEKRALGYITLIGHALSYMHTEKHLCHYDVKPSNIVLDKKGTPKLIDFGISKNYDNDGNQTSSTPVGVSSGFAPLEQYQQSVSEFSPQTDVYALGATFYYLLSGNVPPEASIVLNEGLPTLPNTTSKKTCEAIEQATMPIKKHRPQTMKAFLELLLGKDGLSNNIFDESIPLESMPEAGKDDKDIEDTYYEQAMPFVKEETTAVYLKRKEFSIVFVPNGVVLNIMDKRFKRKYDEDDYLSLLKKIEGIIKLAPEGEKDSSLLIKLWDNEGMYFKKYLSESSKIQLYRVMPYVTDLLNDAEKASKIYLNTNIEKPAPSEKLFAGWGEFFVIVLVTVCLVLAIIGSIRGLV